MPGTLIDPPKTYRNSKTNMTGWIVAKTRSWGVRAIRMRFRRATTMASAKAADFGSLAGVTGAMLGGEGTGEEVEIAVIPAFPPAGASSRAARESRHRSWSVP